jgi:hypothetical protein
MVPNSVECITAAALDHIKWTTYVGRGRQIFARSWPPSRPNNRLQGMRGLACFPPDESLARRPRTPDPCVVTLLLTDPATVRWRTTGSPVGRDGEQRLPLWLSAPWPPDGLER